MTPIDHWHLYKTGLARRAFSAATEKVSKEIQKDIRAGIKAVKANPNASISFGSHIAERCLKSLEEDERLYSNLDDYLQSPFATARNLNKEQRFAKEKATEKANLYIALNAYIKAGKKLNAEAKVKYLPAHLAMLRRTSKKIKLDAISFQAVVTEIANHKKIIQLNRELNKKLGISMA